MAISAKHLVNVEMYEKMHLWVVERMRLKMKMILQLRRLVNFIWLYNMWLCFSCSHFCLASCTGLLDVMVVVS